MRSYYGKSRSKGSINQYQSTTTHFNAGLNSHASPHSIRDDHLSDAFEARVNDYNDSIQLGCRKIKNGSHTILTGNGRIITGISDVDAFHLITIDDLLLTDDGTIDDWHVIKGTSVTAYDISSYGLTLTKTATTQWIGIPSMCILNTEALTYVCLATDQQKKLLIYDYEKFRLVALPFYPKALKAHYNHIFAIDTGNKLWWSRAGDPFTWYGMEEDDDRLTTLTNMLDSGTYTIEQQPDVARPLSFTVVKVGDLDTLGVLTVVGTDAKKEYQEKAYNLVEGKYITSEAWTTVDTITASGHTAKGTVDRIKIGIAPVGGFVQEDAGVASIETEPYLTGIAPIGDSLYIGSPNNIYCLSGYDYQTYALDKVVSGVGSLNGDCIVNNVAYFTHGEDVYEFDGESYPKIISRPVYANGNVVNGIYGGIKTTAYPRASDGKNIYLNTENLGHSQTVDDYYSESEGSYDDNYDYIQKYYYEFNIRSRTWWKRATPLILIPKHPESMLKDIYFYPSYGMQPVMVFTSYFNVNGAYWQYYIYTNETLDGKTYFVTKAFQEGVSQDVTLTEISILCRSEYARYYTDFELNIYYSTSINADAKDPDDWNLLESFTYGSIGEDENPLEELTMISIPLIGSEIARSLCYKLKFEWICEADLDIYEIERRYRTIGRSR